MSEKFNQYYLIETLSKKYSHTTYLASPTDEPERQVVLNVFASSLFPFPFPRECENLLQKAQRIRQLQHPRLMSILDMGIEEEQPFVVREFLPNESLRNRLKRLSPRRLKLGDVLTIILQVGGALAYAHEYNVVHGNIKPENILFDENGQAVLADFSLVGKKEANIRDQTAEEYAFCYLAPEQFAGVCDARSDQYALGCLAYELITGRVPFAAQSLSTMMGHQSNARPAALSENVADLPLSLEAAILKTLAKDPAERFFDFSLFLDVIQSILSPPPAFPLVRSDRSRRNRAIAHSVRSAQVRDAAFPMSNRTALPDPVSQLLEPSGASFSAEVDVTKPVKTSSLFQVSMPEWAGIIPFPYESLTLALQAYPFTPPLSEKVDPIDNGENKSPSLLLKVQEPEGSSATKLEAVVQVEFPTTKQDKTTWTGEEHPNSLLLDIREETDAFYAISTLGSYNGYNEYVAEEEVLAFTRSLDKDEPQPVQQLYGRRRALGLTVLLSVIVALIVYIFLPLVVPILNTSLHTVNNTQVIIPQTTSISAAQVSTQLAAMPTVQASVTNTPVVQSTVLVKNMPATAVIPAPTSYEAEVPQNTIAGTAKVISCSGCSGGYRVGILGLQSNGGKGTLWFKNVNKNTAGSYSLTIYYTEGDSGSMTGYISVNAGPAITFTGVDTGSFSTVRTVNVMVSLSAGDNTIKFSNTHDRSPSIDKIVV
ncbi:MAG TPA: protein kinase [Ktedonobacteraceae bacterium]